MESHGPATLVIFVAVLIIDGFLDHVVSDYCRSYRARIEKVCSAFVRSRLQSSELRGDGTRLARTIVAVAMTMPRRTGIIYICVCVYIIYIYIYTQYIVIHVCIYIYVFLIHIHLNA